MEIGYLDKIKNNYQNMKQHLKYTPLDNNFDYSHFYKCNIFFKREDLQTVRSFKIRGALNKILSENCKDVVCASAGNHAQGFAYCCQKLHLNGDIFLPTTTPPQKINRIKYFSQNTCKLHIVGDNFDQTLQEATNFSQINNKTFIHPYDDLNVIDGQATLAYEINEQLENMQITPDIIICSIGGGGLISGMSKYFKSINPNIKIYGVEPDYCASMKISVENGYRIKIDTDDTFVDGATVKMVGSETFNICKEYVDKFLTVSNGRLCQEILTLYQNHGIISEPAGALSISCLDQIKDEIVGKNIVCILSGGNNDITRYPEIIEKYMTYKNLRHYYILEFKQKPGELKFFINNILGPDDDIIRFEYMKKTNQNFGNVLIGIETTSPDNIFEINDKLDKFEIKHTKVNLQEQLYKYII